MSKRYFAYILILITFTFTLAKEMGDTPSTRVGGHFKYIYFDNAMGTRTVRSTAGAETAATGQKNSGFTMNFISAYFNSAINNWISLTSFFTFYANSGATASYGRPFGTSSKTSNTTNLGYNSTHSDVFAINLRLPDDYEVQMGMLFGKLTWDYGDLLSWEDTTLTSKFSCSAAAIHDSGIEVRKTYDILGYSLPMTVQILNGAYRYVDGDQTLAFLGRVEPELGDFKFHLTGWKSNLNTGSSDFRYATGIQYTNGPWYVRSEYTQSRQSSERYLLASGSTTTNISLATISSRDDKTYGGYYSVVKYQVYDWLKLEAMYYVYLANFMTSSTAFSPDALEKDEDVYLGAIFTVADGAAIIATYQFGNWTRTDSGVSSAVSSYSIYPYENLNYNRFVIGTRFTF